MNGKFQAWLTPALLAGGLGLLLLVWAEVKDVRAEVKAVDTKLDTALLKLQKHETVLELHGFMSARDLNGQP